MAIRTRIGVVAFVRIPGRIVRRLDVRWLRAAPRRGGGRSLELLVANRGNITEVVDRACVRLTIDRPGRPRATIGPVPRQLLPHSTGIVEFPYGGLLRGRGSARVSVPARAPCRDALGDRALRRVFRLLL